MKFYSPLRYPGGKNRLSKFIAKICKENNINGHYVEPYAGGAAIALFLLFEGYVSKITINDIDRSIYALWYSIINYTEKFCSLIEKTNINIETWHKCKKIHEKKNSSPLLTLGFSTLFLNRTNISGIINGGVIGGLKQNGNYKMDCRFDKKELIQRIKLIAKHKKNIEIYRLDALELIKKIQKESQKTSTIFYFDPPYYLKGKSLYMNFYEHDDHIKVSEEIKKIKNSRWIVSYDNNKQIKEMYEGYRKIEYELFHSAHHAKKSSEVIFFSKNLFIPEDTKPVNNSLTT